MINKTMNTNTDNGAPEMPPEWQAMIDEPIPPEVQAFINAPLPPEVQAFINAPIEVMDDAEFEKVKQICEANEPAIKAFLDKLEEDPRVRAYLDGLED